MPRLSNHSLALKERAMAARAVRAGSNSSKGGFSATMSKTDMAGVPGLERYAALFGNACHPENEDYPGDEYRNPGDSVITFGDDLSRYLDSQGNADYRPSRIIYRLEAKVAKKGTKRDIEAGYPSMPIKRCTGGNKG
jgi:hypothetical protein